VSGARCAAPARGLLLALLVAGMACRARAPGAHRERGGGAGAVSPPPSGYSLATDGAPSRLRFEPGALSFCDGRGRPMRVELATGALGAGGGVCPAAPADPNTACESVPMVTGVRAPPSESTDIVDLDGWSVPAEGRVHDCAGEGQVIALATSAAVLRVDGARRTTLKLSDEGADRVALGSGWIAWSQGARLHLRPASSAAPL